MSDAITGPRGPEHSTPLFTFNFLLSHNIYRKNAHSVRAILRAEPERDRPGANGSAFELRIFMTTTQTASAATPKFDNHGQYSRTGILRYEMIFGEHYISTGGAATTEDLCSRLGSSLRPGVRVLDVGSGIGGAAFHLAKAYGAKVTGIDLAEEMVNIALERTAQLGMGESVKFLLGDVLETAFPEPFDIIWSRDAFMHIPDKPRLFSRLYQLLAPGGRLVITDYAAARRRARPSLKSISRRPATASSSRASMAGCSKPPGSTMSSSTMRRRVSSRFSRARPTVWSPGAANSWRRSRKPTSITWSSAGR